MTISNFPRQGIYSVSDACKIANASQSTLLRWEHMGIFPKRIKVGPRRAGYTVGQVDEWAADPVKWREDHGVKLDDDLAAG